MMLHVKYLYVNNTTATTSKISAQLVHYDDDNDDDVFKIVCQRKQIDFYVRGIFKVAGLYFIYDTYAALYDTCYNRPTHSINCYITGAVDYFPR